MIYDQPVQLIFEFHCAEPDRWVWASREQWDRAWRAWDAKALSERVQLGVDIIEVSQLMLLTRPPWVTYSWRRGY